MKHLEDICWDKVVERLDGVDPEDLARAEQRLAEVEAAPLSVDVVEEMVAKAAPRRILVFRKLHGVAKVAAVVVAALMLTAAGYWLIWGGVRSRETMTYAMAVQLLSDAGQPVKHRHAALDETRGRVQYGITKLREVVNDMSADSPLRAAARTRVDALKRLLLAPSSTAPGTVSEDLAQAVDAMLDAARPTQERVQQVHHVAELAGNGILAIRSAQGLDPVTEAQRALCVQKLLRQIDQ